MNMLSLSEIAANQTAKVFEDVDKMRQLVPSLFATNPHPRMSGKYAFTNTYDILLHMHNRGYRVASIMGGGTSFRKVLVRMRNDKHRVDQRMPEMCVLDSHDGTTPIKLAIGFLDGVCLNGMIAGDFFYARRYLHRVPDLMQQIMLELDDVGEHITRMNKRLDEYTAYTTTIGERLRICDAAITARWGNGDGVDEGFKAMLHAKLLKPRRNEDASQNLYKVMNVVQENTLRGGIHYISNNRMTSIRPISAVDRNVKINQAIWTAADEVLQAA